MKRCIRENIPVIIVFGIILLFAGFYLNQYLHEGETYFYVDEEAKAVLENSTYGIKTPNYEGYKLQSFDQFRLKHNKNDYGTITLEYVNGDKYFGYRTGRVKKGYEDKYPGTYKVNMNKSLKEIPYEEIQLKNTTLYYIDSSKYDIFKDGFNVDGNSYLWVIDDICYSMDWFQFNIEHEEVIKIIESME